MSMRQSGVRYRSAHSAHKDPLVPLSGICKVQQAALQMRTHEQRQAHPLKCLSTAWMQLLHIGIDLRVRKLVFELVCAAHASKPVYMAKR